MTNNPFLKLTHTMSGNRACQQKVEFPLADTQTYNAYWKSVPSVGQHATFQQSLCSYKIDENWRLLPYILCANFYRRRCTIYADNIENKQKFRTDQADVLKHTEILGRMSCCGGQHGYGEPPRMTHSSSTFRTMARPWVQKTAVTSSGGTTSMPASTSLFPRLRAASIHLLRSLNANYAEKYQQCRIDWYKKNVCRSSLKAMRYLCSPTRSLQTASYARSFQSRLHRISRTPLGAWSTSLEAATCSMSPPSPSCS